ncbi:MAG: MarR family transcriptional regulator for hemolysin [Myxococcota bacterium]|jgi:MarR family transcriptional regulator for hemolysin
MTEPSKHELDAPPWLRVESTLMSLARGIRRAYDLRLEGLGMNLSEASTLAFTQESGPLMQAELAKHMGVGRAAMGSCIDSLEGRGFVERRPKPGDRRVWLVATTPLGNDMAKQVGKIDETFRAELREGVSRKERRELTQLLNRLADNVSTIVASTTQEKGSTQNN